MYQRVIIKAFFSLAFIPKSESRREGLLAKYEYIFIALIDKTQHVQ